jgi:hypothetical protein
MWGWLPYGLGRRPGMRCAGWEQCLALLPVTVTTTITAVTSTTITASFATVGVDSNRLSSSAWALSPSKRQTARP